ncbi:MAG: autotransporter outer membrane beta-barrel domain-containing protein [Phycisphaerales bacterium]|nr:autotransporter outer membrane beta-barrel domain-containing protein [Phycisphaerales bacterium]
MIHARFIVSLTALTLLGVTANPLFAQEEQDNNYNGGDDGTGTDFDLEDNWDKGGPGTGDPGGVRDFDFEGISFELGEDPITLILGSDGYENISQMDILSRTAITLDGTDLNYLNFEDNASLNTGDGALRITELDLQLSGSMTFYYGNNDEDDPAVTIEQGVGGQTNLAWNLIIEGEINDGSVEGDPESGGGWGDETLTFAGNGFALLTGGIRGGGTGEDGEEDATEWALAMNQGASLMFAGGAEYWLGGGVNMNYSGGSEDARGDGRGILQVTNGATLDTTEDGEGGSSSGDIDLDGWSALLIGSIDIDESARSYDNLEDLGFDLDAETTTIGYDTALAEEGIDSRVNTNEMFLGGNAAVVIGSDGSLEGDNVQLGGSSTILVQGGLTGAENFNISVRDMDIESAATLINYGRIEITDTNGSFTSQGTIVNGGYIHALNDFTSGGTLDIITDGLLDIDGNAIFSGVTTVTGGTIEVDGSFGLDGTMTLENSASVDAGTYDEDELSQIEILGNLTISSGSSFSSFGDTTITSEVYIDGGIFNVGTEKQDAMAFQLGSVGARIGGYGNLNINNETGLLLNGGTLFVGEQDGEGGYVGSNRTLEVEGGDIDATGSTVEFAISCDEDGNATNSQMDLNGNTINFDEDSTVALAVSGENYIESNTAFELIIGGTIQDWTDADLVDLVMSNSVTRYFEYDGDGVVILQADYNKNAGSFQQNASWLGSNTGSLGDMAHEFDQVGTVSGYQFALQQLQPTTFTAGQQVVADTRHFSVLRDAVRGVNMQQTQRRPGPAPRPLGQESYSMLASQDEADAIRSQYGYGAGPQSGAQRTENDTDFVAFVQGYGRSIDLSNRDGVLGISANSWGVVAGVANQLSDETMLGLLIGYDSFDGTVNDNGGSVDVSTIRVGPFFSWSDGSWIADAAVTGGYNQWNGTNNTGLGGNGFYDWDTTGYQIDTSVGLGYSIPVGGGINLIPEGSLVYSFLHTDSYSGKNTTGQNYNVSSSDMNALIPRLGMTAQFNFISGVILEGRAGWQGNYTTGGGVDTTIDNIGGLPTTADSVNRNNIYYGAQVTWMPDWNYGLSLQYEGQSGDGTNEQSIIGSFNFDF